MLVCSNCSLSFQHKGFSSHERTCQKLAEIRKGRERRQMKKGASSQEAIAKARAPESSSDTINALSQNANSEMHDDATIDLSAPIITDDSVPTQPESQEQIPPRHVANGGTYVRIEFHPSSRLPDRFLTLDEYLDTRAGDSPNTKPDSKATTPLKYPWYPFKSEADFDFTDFIKDVRLTNRQIDEQLCRMRNLWYKGVESSVSFKTHKDIDEALEAMRETGNKFTTKSSSASYNDYTGAAVCVQFEYQIRSLFDVIRDVIRDPLLAPHIQWYPTRRFLAVDGVEHQFIDDIDCTTDWWDLQTTVAAQGGEGIYVPAKLYADGTQAYKFRGKMFCPIILRLPFFPSSIRNGSGKGGGTLVGWIPQIEMPATEKDSVSWTDFMNKIVHVVLADLFATIQVSSQIGSPVFDMENVRRLIHIGVMIVAVDFEEAAKFALTRGVKALYPCPICLVPQDALNVISPIDLSRTQSQSIEVYQDTEPLMRTYGQITFAEGMLKQYGLRPVRNAFWTVRNSDVHRAIAYDIGHGIDGGIIKRLLLDVFGYLSKDFKERVNLLMIDERFKRLKAWKQWTVLEKVTEVSYVDQRTWLSIFMRIPGVLWDLDQDGRRSMKPVLRCMRALACLRLVLGIHFVLDSHIELAKTLVLNFVDSLPGASRVLGDEFNIPKVHLLIQHAIDHIQRKGPLKDIGTMLGEHGHIEVHEDFEQVGGFESEKQVTKLRETRTMLQDIRERVDEYNNSLYEAEGDSQCSPSHQRKKKCLPTPENPVLGSPQCKIPLWQLDQSEPIGKKERSNPFQNSSRQLVEFLRDHSGSNIFPVIEDNGDIQPYESLQVCYRSLSTQQLTFEYARCTTLFYRRSRCDSVLVDSPNGRFFARLQGLYKCQAFNKIWSVARVSKLKLVRNAKAEVIGFPHVQEERNGMWISVSWITRYIYDQPSFGSRDDEYFMNDLMDSDMFLRLLG